MTLSALTILTWHGLALTGPAYQGKMRSECWFKSYMLNSRDAPLEGKVSAGVCKHECFQAEGPVHLHLCLGWPEVSILTLPGPDERLK